MRLPPNIALVAALTLSTTACTQYQADPKSITAAPQAGSAIVILKTPAINVSDVPATTVLGQPHFVGDLLITPYDPRAVEGGKIVTGLTFIEFSGAIRFNNDTPGGFQAYAFSPGDYVIKALHRSFQFTCFNEGSLAFHLNAGQSLYLGNFNAGALLTHIGEEAIRDKTARTHTHTAAFGLSEFYTGNETLDQTSSGWLPPTPADTAQAQAFLQTNYAGNAAVTPAILTPVTWLTQPGRNQMDTCGTSPGTTHSAFLKLQSASLAGFVVSYGDPPTDPRPFLPGITLIPTTANPQHYLWPLDHTISLADGACQPTTEAELLRLAQRPGDIGVQFTTFANKDGTPWSPPEVHVFARDTSDTIRCQAIAEVAPPAFGRGMTYSPIPMHH